MLLGQLAVVCYRFLGGGQGLLPPAQLGERIAQHSQNFCLLLLRQ